MVWALELEAIADAAIIVAIVLTLMLLALAAIVLALGRVVAAVIPNVTVAGLHLGAWLRDKVLAASSALYGWVLHWFHAELHALGVMLRASGELISETFDLVEDAVRVTAHAFDTVFGHAIPDAIRVSRNYADRLAERLGNRIDDLAGIVSRDVTRLIHLIDDLAERVPHMIRNAIHDLIVDVINPLAHDLANLGRRVVDYVIPRLDAVWDRVEALQAAIAAGVGTIEDVLPRLPGMTVDEIEDLINRVPWRRLAGLLTFGFLTHALLKALMREAGLERAECRRKVRGVCGADMDAWENLLTGLIGGLALANFGELVNACRSVVDEVVDEFIDYGGMGG